MPQGLIISKQKLIRNRITSVVYVWENYETANHLISEWS